MNTFLTGLLIFALLVLLSLVGLAAVWLRDAASEWRAASDEWAKAAHITLASTRRPRPTRAELEDVETLLTGDAA